MSDQDILTCEVRKPLDIFRLLYKEGELYMRAPRFKFRYLKRSDILVVEVHGEFDKDAQKHITTEMVKELKKHNSCTKILFDHRDAVPKLGIYDQYERPSVALSLGVGRENSIAIVYSKQEAVYQFIETRAFNYGFTCKVFTDYNKAKEWLKENGYTPRFSNHFL